MYGIQLIKLLDLLPVNTVRNAKGVHPRSLVVTGKDFRNIEKVLINGAESPGFMVYSPTELIAEVPGVFQSAPIDSVAVLSSSLTFSGRSLVMFTVGSRVRKVRGILRLMQVFLRILLRTPGSNLFHRRSGGGLLSRIGTNITNGAAADAVIAVDTTRTYIVGVQASDRNIPPNERLLSAEVANVSVDPQNGSITLTVLLTNHSGTTAAATIST